MQNSTPPIIDVQISCRVKQKHSRDCLASRATAQCATCKAKRVKCDEKRLCGYCAKRPLSCSLASTQLSLLPGTQKRWYVILAMSVYKTPSLGQYPYVLHKVLAVLHLRTTASDQSLYLERTAAERQDSAIPLSREVLAANSTETAPRLFACRCLFVPNPRTTSRRSALMRKPNPNRMARSLSAMRSSRRKT
ncbi:hypothetical protein GGR53DRAFT_256286 [Hypoxylon sp. FL1150]|nr:hypothetical protein GGR53DRAFT_256286 [Hypoxylon sp. FL1150]